MNKTFKKAIAVILSVLMVVISVPFTAFAATGDYAPNIRLQFGTFFDGEASDYNDYSTSGNAASDFSYSSLRGVPVDYKYKVTNGVASGTLYIDKDKANTYNEASESGYSTLSENKEFGVGDYFTMTVITDNIKRNSMTALDLAFGDTIELAGVYSYKSGKTTKYALGSESEMKAANKGSWFIGGSNYLRAFSTCKGEGLHNDLISATGAADINTSAVLTDSEGNTTGIHFGLPTPNMDVTTTTSSEEDGVFYDPATGEGGYTYTDCAIIATFVFKIVKDGNIDFKLKDPSSVNGCYYIADSADGIEPDKYTTYARNFYNPSDATYTGTTEWAGSTKMTFMGQNQWVDTPSETTYEVKFVNAAGETVDTQTVKEGETPTVPSTNTAAKTVSNNDGTHTVTTYTWPAVSAASADVEYDEVATDKADNCTLNYTETTKATIVSGATLTATCPVCNYVSTQTGEALNGTAYYAALNAAKAVDGTKYTADSYAKVTAALETYAQAKVEAMTSQSDVDAATKALQDAVSGLVALPTTDTYTYTFADGTTKEVTVDKGTTPTAPTNTASSVKDNGDGTHTSTSYSWNKTGDFTYSEVATNDKASCSYGDYTVVTKATIAKAGSETATCSVCGHVDTRATAKLNGDDYYTALAAAKAVNADNYTADSYAKVTAALETYAQAKVEAYTDQAAVDNATVALREAVSGLVKAYTITFTNAAGTVVDTQKVAAGQTPTVPSVTTPATAVTSDGNGKTHSHTTYAWPAVSAATENADYKEVATKVTDNCTEGDPVVTQPTLDKEGSEVTSCTVCGQVLSTKTIPALKGVNVTVTKTAYGTTTLNSEDATNGKTTKVLANSTVTVTAKANKDAEFVGWKVAQKLVSTDETYSFTAVADTEITPVFTETAETTFVVVFVDMYGNVVDTQEVANGSEINEPTAPIYPGYTFKGWALSADEIDALTEGTTIRAVYEKDAAQTYTVKAAGATITVGGKDYTGVAEGVAYDAKVTVTKAGATSWEVNGSTVGYGESYSFFCASDVELTAVTKADDTVKTQVAIVSTVRPSNTACDVIYTATRVVGDNETIVSQGFVYGKNAVASDLTLENVGKTASGTNAGKVKVIYNKNDYTQFALNYGISAMTGTAAARAFVVTKDADGNVKVTYSDAVLYTYGA